MSQAVSVAKELVRLSLAGEEKDPLTNLRLQKLLYYAQAWSLVVRESELFSEDIEAWRWGPVVPAVYRQLPTGQGDKPVGTEAFADAPDLPGEEAEFVSRIWDAYDSFSAIQLSRMTHGEEPWVKTWGDRAQDSCGNEPISLELLEDYFGKQAMPAALAAYRHELRHREEAAERRLADVPSLDLARLRAGATSLTATARFLVGKE